GTEGARAERHDSDQGHDRPATLGGCSSRQHHAPKALCGPIPSTIAKLLRGTTEPALGVGEIRELALMAAKRRDLAVEGLTDVDELVRLVGAPEEHLGDLPGLQARIQMLAEVERVSGRGKD